MSRFIEVAKTEEIRSGTMKKVTVEGQEILLARVGDNYYAASSRCPHMNGDLSQGTLEGTVVTCPRHGSQFDISNGQVVRWLKGGLMSKLGGALKTPKGLRCTTSKWKIAGCWLNSSARLEIDSEVYNGREFQDRAYGQQCVCWP